MSNTELFIKLKFKILLFINLIVFIISTNISANEPIKQETNMSINGKFEITLEPQQDKDHPAGRMLINKSYSGLLNGTGVGQMISKRLENGNAVYFAIEEFVGTVEGKSGAFSLIHKGFMSKDSQTLEISILEGSGQDELKNISGSMNIIQKNGAHSYELEYQL